MSKASTSLDPEKSLTHLLEECRMVLPGIQALFGFQLVAVFNTPFKQLLDDREQDRPFQRYVSRVGRGRIGNGTCGVSSSV
jgi:hypothetical protein